MIVRHNIAIENEWSAIDSHLEAKDEPNFYPTLTINIF